MKTLLLVLFTFNITAQTLSLNDGVKKISEYIISDRFSELINNKNDIELVDSIYLFALKVYEGDISEALLALTLVTLPFKKMPLNIPFVGIKLKAELSSVSDSIFSKKVRNIPSKLFVDTDSNNFGDKDKLAHFFGNAFLSYNFTFINVAKFFSLFIEYFEETFKINGAVDVRDLSVDLLGEHFGDSLNYNPDLLPSQFISGKSLREIIKSHPV